MKETGCQIGHRNISPKRNLKLHLTKKAAAGLLLPRITALQAMPISAIHLNIFAPAFWADPLFSAATTAGDSRELFARQFKTFSFG